MILKWPSVTVTVVTVVFFDISPPLIIYINTYISISYIIFRRGLHYSFFNCNNCNCNTMVGYLLLYKAPKSLTKFIVHSYGIAVHDEAHQP